MIYERSLTPSPSVCFLPCHQSTAASSRPRTVARSQVNRADISTPVRPAIRPHTHICRSPALVGRTYQPANHILIEGDPLPIRLRRSRFVKAAR